MSLKSTPDNTILPTNLGSFINHFLKPYKIVVILFVCTALFSGVWGPLNAWILKYIVDSTGRAIPGDISFLVWSAILLVLNFVIFDILTWRGIEYLNRQYQPLIKNKILSEVFSYLVHAPLSFFQERFSGRLASQLVILADNVERILEYYIPNLLRSFSLLLVSLIGMWSVDIRFFIILITWFVVFFLISYKRSQKLVKLSDAYTARESKNSGQFVDVLLNINNVRMFVNSKHEVNRIHTFLDKTKIAYQEMKAYLIILHSVQGGLIALMLAGMLYYLTLLYQQNQATVGDFVLIIGLSIKVGHMIWFAMEVVNEFNLAIGKCKQSLNSLLIQYEMTDINDAKPIKISRGGIQLKDTAFSHKNGQQIFEGFSLQIAPSEKVGLVGFSGTGKSTFMNLILRFFDLNAGQIFIDEQDISQSTQDSLRDQISIIPQDTTLFHRSILENIRYSRRNATDEEVIEAAKQANAHDFILKMPEGYNSFVGERGVKLSAGQKQCIAIARAILKKSPILLLDEATSDLDCISEQKIHESLKKLMLNRTTIVITHRLSILLEMDRILVFDAGRVIEEGSHRELLQRNGHYAKMWCMQTGGFLPD
jgi:ATP-binding cassette subfamily B protein